MEDEITSGFAKMGARVKLKTSERFTVSVDVVRDRKNGEYFSVRHRQDADVSVLEVTPWNRHLLLAVTAPGNGGPEQSTFLCGRDECHWFVAAVPESARARTVQEAKDALKPPEVWDSIRQHRLPPERRDGRRTEAFVRQGEWFFLPRPSLVVQAQDVLEHEPIRRGAGKPHICRYLYRTGGSRVYVSDAYPNGLTRRQFRKLPEEQRRQGWSKMVRAAVVYVKGTVQHPDHKPIWLGCWHQVVMNTETQAAAMRRVAFLD
jgi:hypothetical protein